MSDPDFCPASRDGKHHPDARSVTLTSGGAPPNWYVDVTCGDCGRSGCYTVVYLDDHVDW